MASLRRNLTALLFLVLPLIHSHLSAHAATTSPTTTRRRIKFMTIGGSPDDYTDEYDYDYSAPPKVVAYSLKTPLLASRPKLCPYDPCSESQAPCERLSADVGCLCPGRSGGDVPPRAPRIQTLLPVAEGENVGKVEVQWCAPSSVVSSYRVVVEGRADGTLEFGGASRRGLMGSLEAGTKVCVQAVNAAGESSPSDFSCKRYDHTDSFNNKLLIWIVAGGVAFLLVVILAVILCKCHKHQKAKRHRTEGLKETCPTVCDTVHYNPALQNKPLGLSDKETFALQTEKVV
ncbi:leucine-rich repeat neuronal protein 4 [Austrofundulus limnaeus]|uniref:Leucine-rich repeat neuronal protein 4 n=1 Tax=Austrofundulus limnaeus TaxID=52670 RepID=A0A2I4B203_AUSLI|nr:PREDICTED: LRRN4 C-terminal-like protein [Austrofundulus limnaeus]